VTGVDPPFWQSRAGRTGTKPGGLTEGVVAILWRSRLRAVERVDRVYRGGCKARILSTISPILSLAGSRQVVVALLIAAIGIARDFARCAREFLRLFDTLTLLTRAAGAGMRGSVPHLRLACPPERERLRDDVAEMECLVSGRDRRAGERSREIPCGVPKTHRLTANRGLVIIVPPYVAAGARISAGCRPNDDPDR
jgi:hypothetical protein